MGLKERDWAEGQGRQYVHFRLTNMGFYSIALRITGFLEISCFEQNTLFQNQHVSIFKSNVGSTYPIMYIRNSLSVTELKTGGVLVWHCPNFYSNYASKWRFCPLFLGILDIHVQVTNKSVTHPQIKLTEDLIYFVCGWTIKFVNSPPCACRGSTGQKP